MKLLLKIKGTIVGVYDKMFTANMPAIGLHKEIGGYSHNVHKDFYIEDVPEKLRGSLKIGTTFYYSLYNDFNIKENENEN